METRKVHRVGSSSLAVTLPIRWVHAVGLDAGAAVTFLHEDEASLVLVRADAPHADARSLSMELPSGAPPRQLERVLIGAYVVGFDDIALRASGGFAPEQLEGLRRCTSRLTGLAVVECHPGGFVAKSYLDPAWCDLREHLHRLVALTEGMITLAPAVLGARDAAAAREVLALGEQADRLYYLTVRFLIAAAGDRGLRERMGLDSASEAVGCRLVAKALEEVGDSMETVAEVVLATEGADLGIDAGITEKVQAFSERICGNLSTGVDAFFSGSAQQASEVLEDIYQMEHAKQHFIEEILLHVRSPLGATVLTAAGMALRDVCRFTRVVGEVAMNNAIRRLGKVARPAAPPAPRLAENGPTGA